MWNQRQNLHYYQIKEEFKKAPCEGKSNSALKRRKQPQNIQSAFINGLQWCEGRSYFEKPSAETLLSTVLQRDISIIWAGIHVELNIL